ncbi:hypothetical protein ACFFHM_20795 [Halalkalibacter kiskunsagensis]|uniref:Citrate transporter n=1 Tax=Halalkalibacter kiskunsagensis TaxID=1548599 RepID=A0ABV6KHP3_9BACI
MDLTAPHWIYLIGTLIIILTMLVRQNVVVPAVLMTFFIGWVYTGSFFSGLQTIFQASLTAAGELFNIFLIIAIMTALLHSLKAIGADEQMITPFQRVMKNGHISFWVIVGATYAISLFFWPTPAVPLIGALLIPVAIRAGLPPVAAAIAISLAGQGMALSADYMIQIAPMLNATSAGVAVEPVANRAFVLSIITGVVALTYAYFSIRKSIQKPSKKHLIEWEKHGSIETDETSVTTKQSKKQRVFFALFVPISFLIIVVYMVLSMFTDAIPSMEGGAGAALIGGTAVILLVTASSFYNLRNSLTNVSDFLVKGFVFAFKAMGPVIPIAGFFFIGSGEFSAKILGVSAETPPSFLFDLVQAGQQINLRVAF